MGRLIRVLQVEDSTADSEVVLLKLRKAGYDPVSERVETGASLRAALARGPWDVVLCDGFLPGFEPEAALQVVREAEPGMPFLVVSGSIGGDRVADLLRAGADDYVFKGRLSRLGPAVERALREAGQRHAKVAPTDQPAGYHIRTPLLADPPPPVAVRSFGLTDPGKVRPANEDQFLIAELARTLWVHQTSLPQPATHHGRNRGHVFLVADGMGGHQAGEVASALSVATVEAFVLHLLRRFSNLQAADEQGVLTDLQEALCRADALILEEAAQHPEFTGMGTTLTLALASGWKLFVLHAGDSRCYRFRGGQLSPLTEDQTVAAEMARLGILGPEEARRHRLRHVVTSVLGGREAGVRVAVRRADLEPGDVVLLCSDGLTEMLPDDRITAVLAAEAEPRAACERLVAEANDRGGLDNITAVVARFEAD